MGRQRRGVRLQGDGDWGGHGRRRGDGGGGM